MIRYYFSRVVSSSVARIFFTLLRRNMRTLWTHSTWLFVSSWTLNGLFQSRQSSEITENRLRQNSKIISSNKKYIGENTRIQINFKLIRKFRIIKNFSSRAPAEQTLSQLAKVKMNQKMWNSESMDGGVCYRFSISFPYSTNAVALPWILQLRLEKAYNWFDMGII